MNGMRDVRCGAWMDVLEYASECGICLHIRDSNCATLCIAVRWLAVCVCVCRITNSQNRDNNHLVLVDYPIHFPFAARRSFELAATAAAAIPIYWLVCVCVFVCILPARENGNCCFSFVYNELNEWIIRRKRRWTARRIECVAVYFPYYNIMDDGPKAGIDEPNACSAPTKQRCCISCTNVRNSISIAYIIFG